MLLCIYMHKSGWTRKVRGRMIRSIDVEYKRIETLTENLSQILSQSTQTRSVDENGGSELSSLKYVLSECKHPKIWAQGRASAMVVTAHSVIYMMATTVACKQLKDFLCLARKYKKKTSRRPWKWVWRRPGGLQNCLWRRLRARIALEIDFGPILDPILGGVLRSKSSSDGTRSRVQGSICFQDRFGNDLAPFWHRFWNDFGVPESS